MVEYVKGSSLPYRLQQEALRSYVHRFTRDHRPQWARKGMPDGSPYPVQFASDGDWLDHTLLPVTKAGKLGAGDCVSSPTWPDNPELRKDA